MAEPKKVVIFVETIKNIDKMKNTEINKLIEKDFNEFEKQFGKQALRQVIISGNLPLRRETIDKIKKTKQGRKIDFSKFL